MNRLLACLFVLFVGAMVTSCDSSTGAPASSADSRADALVGRWISSSQSGAFGSLTFRKDGSFLSTESAGPESDRCNSLSPTPARPGMQTCATRLAGLWSVQKDSLILKVARTEVSMNGTDWNGYATPYVKSHGYALSGDSLTLMVPVINLRMTYHKDGASGTK